MSATLHPPSTRPAVNGPSDRLTRLLEVAIGVSILVAIHGFLSLDPARRAAPPAPTMCEWDGAAVRLILNWIHPHGWTIGFGGSLAVVLCSMLLRAVRRTVHGGRVLDMRDSMGGRRHEVSIPKNSAPQWLITLLLLASACSDALPPSAPRTDVGGVPMAHRVAGQSRSAVAKVGMDSVFASVAAQVPSFAGAFVRSSGQLVIALTDTLFGPAALRALRPLLIARGNPSRPVRFYRVPFRYDSLDAWRQRVSSEIRTGVLAYLYLDEEQNAVVVGVTSEAGRTQVERIGESLGIPRGAIRIGVAGVTSYLADSLTSSLLPRRGGLGITRRSGTLVYRCTLGWNATKNNVRYFVTNSHCTDSMGVNTGTIFHQYLPGVATRIGVEALDPPFFDSTTNAACPGGQRCRYSDAVLVKYDGSVLSEFAVALTTRRGAAPFTSGSVEIDPTRPKAAAYVTWYPLTGDTLQKVGVHTGWTQGVVVDACARIDIGTQSFLCNAIVRGYAAGGDSGSPVFSMYKTDPYAWPAGLLWGRPTQDSTLYYFSSVDNLRRELGADAFLQFR